MTDVAHKGNEIGRLPALALRAGLYFAVITFGFPRFCRAKPSLLTESWQSGELLVLRTLQGQAVGLVYIIYACACEMGYYPWRVKTR